MNEFEKNPQYKGNEVIDAGIGFIVSFLFFMALFGVGFIISIIN